MVGPVQPIGATLTARFYQGKIFVMSAFNVLKRGYDVLIALSALIILSPLLAIIGLIIRLSSNGTAVFKQERAGMNGKPFVFYKFRTMKAGVDPYGPSPKSGGDTRLTRFGRFLREYSLDELPQLFNILKGDMSVVGPRPLYLSQIPEWNERQKRRLCVKPGLTGLAQVSGRGRITREEKLELDVKYVETASLSGDVRIILATIAQIFGRRNIYEKRYSQTEYTRGTKR
ncbi:MAG: sugar transferase [Planctomycetota bacterium]|jgi:lipopolysaccharide/colanic/teichoic acid biosynthesis glycosyltransferase